MYRSVHADVDATAFCWAMATAHRTFQLCDGRRGARHVYLPRVILEHEGRAEEARDTDRSLVLELISEGYIDIQSLV